MAQVYGQIGPLKHIRKTLDSNGINRFNSIDEIYTFLETVDHEKDIVYQDCEKEYADDIYEYEEKLRYNQEALEKVKRKEFAKIDEKIKHNLTILRKYRSSNSKFFLTRFFNFLLYKLYEKRVSTLQKDLVVIVNSSTKKLRKKITRTEKRIDHMLSDKQGEIRLKSASRINNLELIKNIAEGLSPSITGAIGENKVVKEISKLSDENILINDFSLKFNPPIYNRQENERIHSIQIDHLLITRAGVFILETKNWSEKTINSYSKWSPIDQIRRTSYALFFLLNKNKIKLNWHHWGEKQIPIRSIVVMINQKPKEDFKYVKVKTLKELNSYIQFFEPKFTDREFAEVSNYLIKLSISN